MNSELCEKECPACKGTGENPDAKDNCSLDLICFKCNGKGTLDWIENIVGVVGTYIKPGVYTMEVDYSEYIAVPGTFKRGSVNDPWRFVSDEDKRELLGELNGE